MPSRIGDALHWHATYSPDKIAVVSSEGTQTYAQLWPASASGQRLADMGLCPGDRIALLMQNSSRYHRDVPGRGADGAGGRPPEFQVRAASEIEYVVHHAGARALMFDASFAGTVRSLRTKLPSVNGRYIITDGEELETLGYEGLVASGDRIRHLPCRPTSPALFSRAIPGVGHDWLSEGLRQPA